MVSPSSRLDCRPKHQAFLRCTIHRLCSHEYIKLSYLIFPTLIRVFISFIQPSTQCKYHNLVEIGKNI